MGKTGKGTNTVRKTVIRHLLSVVPYIYGHTTGDDFLRIAAARFQSILRPQDVLTRIGGDEFIAVLHGVNDRKEAGRLGERLLESLTCRFRSATHCRSHAQRVSA
jgi:diguanylate cyclase (GGDEF)-like protein